MLVVGTPDFVGTGFESLRRLCLTVAYPEDLESFLVLAWCRVALGQSLQGMCDSDCLWFQVFLCLQRSEPSPLTDLNKSGKASLVSLCIIVLSLGQATLLCCPAQSKSGQNSPDAKGPHNIPLAEDPGQATWGTE